MTKRLELLEKHQLPWDLLYAGRCGRPGVECGVLDGIVVPGFSYCLHGYLLTAQGATKLIEAGLGQAIIPADEYLPNFYCEHPRTDVRTLYKRPASFSAYAIIPDIVHQKQPVGEATVETDRAARVDSDTVKSPFYQGKSIEIVSSPVRITPHPTFSYSVVFTADGISGVTAQVLGRQSQFSPLAALVLRELQDAKSASCDQISSATGLEPDEVRRLLDNMLRAGIVECSG